MVFCTSQVSKNRFQGPTAPGAEGKDHTVIVLHPRLPTQATGWNLTNGKKRKILKPRNYTQRLSVHTGWQSHRAQARLGGARRPPCLLRRAWPPRAGAGLV